MVDVYGVDLHTTQAGRQETEMDKKTGRERGRQVQKCVDAVRPTTLVADGRLSSLYVSTHTIPFVHASPFPLTCGTALPVITADNTSHEKGMGKKSHHITLMYYLA